MSFDQNNPVSIAGKGIQGGFPTNGQQLQFNSATNLWEFVAPTVAALGDIEFLRDKQLSGDLIILTGIGVAVAPTTVLSTTPASGKTYFVAKASYFIENNKGTAEEVDLETQNDGTVKDLKATKQLANATMNFGLSANIGDSMVGDGAIIYRVQKVTGAVNTGPHATLTGWIQDT